MAHTHYCLHTQETFISADDLRVNLWHLGTNEQSFNIVDIKPANMEDLTEVRVLLNADIQCCGDSKFGKGDGAICVRLSNSVF